MLMFRKTAAAAAMGAGLLLAAAGSASAYTMDSAGTGWVGKGEVQSAYGWNNKAMQDNVGGVTFAYDSTASYEVVCEFDNPGGHHVITTHKRSDRSRRPWAATPARTAAASRDR